MALCLTWQGIALAANVSDEERWYQVELIVFEHKSTNDNATEVWADDPGQPDQEQAVELLRPPITTANSISAEKNLAEPPPFDANSVAITENDDSEATPQAHYQAFELLPEGLLTLNDSIERMNNTNDYQPLLHIGWRQRVPERNNAQAIVIDSRKLLLHIARLDDNAENMTNTPDAIDTDTQTQAEPQTVSTADEAIPPPSLYDQGPDEILTEINENFVNGTLSLTRGRYLHMNLDLLYQRQSNTPQLFSFFGFGNNSNTPEHYRLTQQRRLKRGEIHYFDHPKFGVLAMVTAVEQEEPDQVRTIPLNKRLQ